MLRFALASLALTLAASPALADNAPPPPPPPAAAEVLIEITDASAAASAFSGALAIAAGDCGSLEAGPSSARYRIKLCFNGREPTPHVLSIEVDRELVKGKDISRQHVATTARIDAGKRIVVARFGAGTDTTEIAATVK